MNYWKKVAIFKNKFYRSNRSKYNLATKADLKLLPPEESLEALKEDYKKMESMLFGERVSFEEVLNGLSNLLEEIREM